MLSIITCELASGAELKRPFVQSNVNGRRGPTQPPNHATHPA